MNQCRREGMKTREGQAIGNMYRGGQRKGEFNRNRERESTGTDEAGEKLCVDIVEDMERMPVSTKGCFSQAPEKE